MLHFIQGQDNVLVIPLENASSEFDYFVFNVTSTTQTAISGEELPYYFTIDKQSDKSSFPERYSEFIIDQRTFSTSFNHNGEYELTYEIFDSADGGRMDVLLKKGKLIVHVYGQGFYTQPTDTNFTFKQRS